MADTKTMIEQAYSSFNKRDIDGALALMTQDVNWPKASEGGKVVGKEEIRAYWTRQWGEFDPHVEPLAMTEEDGGKIRVRVHQLVKSLQGDVLSDGEVLHVFTMKNGLIAAMDLGGETTRYITMFEPTYQNPDDGTITACKKKSNTQMNNCHLDRVPCWLIAVRSVLRTTWK